MRKLRVYYFLVLFVIFIPFAAHAEDGAQTGIASPVMSRPVVAQQSVSPDKISLDIKGMDIIDVLKMLATKADLNLVIDKNVSGRVMVFLKDVKPKEALDVILASNNLVAQPEGNITRIMTGQDYEQLFGKKFYDQRQLLRIPLKYAKPQDFIPLLNQVKSSVGLILADDATNGFILLDVKEKNDIMAKMIGEMDAPLKTEVFKLNYAKAESVATALSDVVTKGIATIKVDNRVNQVIVTDYENKMAKIKSMVSNFDERTKEVEIDAKIVQVNLNDKTSFGIDWEYVLNKKLNVKGMFGHVITTTGNKWTVGTANPKDHNDYSAVIEALKTIGSTKILSSPRLTVVNNESAKILVGSKQVYVTTAAVQSQTSTETAETVNFVDVGVKLYVTPSISHDGFVSLKIRPEVSSVLQNYTTSTGNIIPIVDTSEAETTVLVEDGSTVVIAGLMKEEKIKTINKIPLIGDIPFLGALFRNTIDEIKKTELVIFLTCKIVDFGLKEKT